MTTADMSSREYDIVKMIGLTCCTRSQAEALLDRASNPKVHAVQVALHVFIEELTKRPNAFSVAERTRYEALERAIRAL